MSVQQGTSVPQGHLFLLSTSVLLVRGVTRLDLKELTSALTVHPGKMNSFLGLPNIKLSQTTEISCKIDESGGVI